MTQRVEIEPELEITFKNIFRILLIYLIPITCFVVGLIFLAKEDSDKANALMLISFFLFIVFIGFHIQYVENRDREKNLEKWVKELKFIENGKIYLGENIKLVCELPNNSNHLLCITNNGQWLVVEYWTNSYTRILNEDQAKSILKHDIGKYEQYFGKPTIG